MAAGLTLDSGALIAAEKQSRRAWVVLKETMRRGLPLTIPAGVLAQVWRAKAPVVARLCKAAEVEVLDEQGARMIGVSLGRAGTSDVVDASVVVGALRRGDAVLTADVEDLQRVAQGLEQKLRCIRV